MSSILGDEINDFYASKKQEVEEANKSNIEKETIKLLFEKVGDICSVTIGDVVVSGRVKDYFIKRVDEIERMEIDLEVGHE